MSSTDAAVDAATDAAVEAPAADASVRESGPEGPGDAAFDAALMLRAARRASGLSQRELAELAGVPSSTVARIEAGATSPRLETVDRLLRAAGFALVAVAGAGAGAPAAAVPAAAAPTAGSEEVTGRLVPDAAHDAIRDRAGRRFPAHLDWDGRPEYMSDSPWWGWHNIAWPALQAAVPDHIYWRRTDPNSRDARIMALCGVGTTPRSGARPSSSRRKRTAA